MARTWTPAQSTAMQYQSTSLLVSAAAGSGKTATLTQRIIDQIVHDESCTLERMLIVTFTRAAAAELRSRIASALTEAIARDPANRHLNRQLLLLPGAHIHTIDAFFGEPVRANFERLNLPAGFRMADEGETAAVGTAVMQEVMELMYEECRDSENGILGMAREGTFLRFVETLVSSRDFSALIPTLTALYQKLVTSEQGVARVSALAERLQAEAELDFFNSLWGKQLCAHAVDTLRASEQKFLKAKEQIASDPVCGKSFAQMFDSDAARCGMIANGLQNGTYAKAAEVFDAHPATKKPTVKAAEKTPLCEEFEAFRKKQNDKIKKLAAEFSADPAEIREQFLATADICRTLGHIMAEYDTRYAEEKRRLGICEFSDMPRFMLQLLQAPDGSLTDLARAYQDKFDWVYIDEYQDVNQLQDKIFAIIGGDHRFMVGDIKQSIYGFREADPSIFAGYRRAFATLTPDNPENPPETDQGCVLFMSENFRCDQNVIDFTNLVCSYIFSACPETIGYRPADDLIHKKPTAPDYQSPLVRVMITQPAEADEEDTDADDDEIPDSSDTEITAAVNEIVRLLREETKADGTPILPSDIAILCRTKALSHVLDRSAGCGRSGLHAIGRTALRQPAIQILALASGRGGQSFAGRTACLSADRAARIHARALYRRADRPHSHPSPRQSFSVCCHCALCRDGGRCRIARALPCFLQLAAAIPRACNPAWRGRAALRTGAGRTSCRACHRRGLSLALRKRASVHQEKLERSLRLCARTAPRGLCQVILIRGFACG